MQVNSKIIKSRFEKSMDTYDKNAVIQLESAEKLIDALYSFKSDFGTVIELGVGTGILTRCAVDKLTFDNYIGNDLVRKSKTYLKKIVPNASFVEGNAIKIHVGERADLILSNAMFQWIPDFSAVVKKCKSMLNPDGILAFSTFGGKNFQEVHEVSGISLDYLNMSEILDILKNDYEILYKEEYIRTLNFDSPLDMLLHMKNTGVNSLSDKAWSVGDLKTFCKNYLNMYDVVKLTYNPVIVVAKLVK